MHIISTLYFNPAAKQKEALFLIAKVDYIIHKYRLKFTFLKPMSAAYSLKHCRQMFKPYLRMSPCLFAQARL